MLLHMPTSDHYLTRGCTYVDIRLVEAGRRSVLQLANALTMARQPQALLCGEIGGQMF